MTEYSATAWSAAAHDEAGKYVPFKPSDVHAMIQGQSQIGLVNGVLPKADKAAHMQATGKRKRADGAQGKHQEPAPEGADASMVKEDCAYLVMERLDSALFTLACMLPCMTH